MSNEEKEKKKNVMRDAMAGRLQEASNFIEPIKSGHDIACGSKTSDSELDEESTRRETHASITDMNVCMRVVEAMAGWRTRVGYPKL